MGSPHTSRGMSPSNHTVACPMNGINNGMAPGVNHEKGSWDVVQAVGRGNYSHGISYEIPMGLPIRCRLGLTYYCGVSYGVSCGTSCGMSAGISHATRPMGHAMGHPMNTLLERSYSRVLVFPWEVLCYYLLCSLMLRDLPPCGTFGFFFIVLSYRYCFLNYRKSLSKYTETFFGSIFFVFLSIRYIETFGTISDAIPGT